MILSRLAVLPALLLMASPAMSEPVFYLNASGGSRYTIMRFSGAFAHPTTPVIGPSNDGGAANVAWPSAFKVSVPVTRVFASRYVGSLWSSIGLWESPDGVNFTYKGAALTANASEPQGIGPSVVAHDTGDSDHWKMIYMVRGAGTSLALADSPTGAVGSWTRRGVVMTATETWEAAGISPSHLFKDTDSDKWVLLYHAYETTDRAYAAMATADDVDGPYSNKTILMNPVSSRNAVTGVAKFTNHGLMAKSPILGQPHVLRQMTPPAMEVVVPVKFENGVVYFDRPVFGDYTSGELAHVATNKIDPSFVERNPDGSWRGLWTGYGQFAGVLSEYTFEVSAPALAGPWSLSTSGLSFQPWTASGILSTENPTPIVAVQ